MSVKSKFKKIASALRNCEAWHSYSQCGEDLILNFLFEWLGISLPTYMDIGAHHPVYLSNTYYFYRKGSRGVCVEPDPGLFRGLKKKRKKDVCLNVGVGSENKEAVFYVMSQKTLNTFSLKEAERYQKDGRYTIVDKIKIPICDINQLIAENFDECPNFISLDVEGMDLIVLQALNFKKHRPEVFCVETLTFTTDNSEEKLTGIIDYMIDNDYLVYGDTYINTIFVDKHKWNDR